MKIEFRFDSDKMRALKMYTEQKGVSLEEELVQAAEGLYQKHVPASVKAFIGHHMMKCSSSQLKRPWTDLPFSESRR